MASILQDKEIALLLGTIIKNGDEGCIRPNSYILRLGAEGEFISTGKEFFLGTDKKGLIIPPGYSVGVTSFEVLDFSMETVESVFPGHALHGFLSPTTDLSREGMVVPATQVDAGFRGALNWTLTNASSQERRFVYKERLFRLTIFKLSPNEIPKKLYKGDYQNQTGYVRSCRSGPPIGMRDTEWIDPHLKDGPEELLSSLIKSGYPWNAVGTRLEEIDKQFKTVSSEYAEIRESMDQVKNEMSRIREQQKEVHETVRNVLSEQISVLEDKWLVKSLGALLGLTGLAVTVLTNEISRHFVQRYGFIVGIVILIFGCALFYRGRRKG